MSIFLEKKYSGTFICKFCFLVPGSDTDMTLTNFQRLVYLSKWIFERALMEKLRDDTGTDVSEFSYTQLLSLGVSQFNSPITQARINKLKTESKQETLEEGIDDGQQIARRGQISSKRYALRYFKKIMKTFKKEFRDRLTTEDMFEIAQTGIEAIYDGR